MMVMVRMAVRTEIHDSKNSSRLCRAGQDDFASDAQSRF